MSVKDFGLLDVKGKNFLQEEKFELIKKDERVSIIYGKNGSGKSSICNAIKAIKESDKKDEYEVLKVYDVNGDELNIEKSDRVYVYNEDFVDSQIKLNQKGMKSIIMFGEQKKLDDIIEEKNNEKIVKDKKLKEIKEKYDNYINKKNLLSPEYYWERMQEILKSDDGWAERERRIKRNKTKSQVKKETIAYILKNRDEDKKKEELIRDYKTKFNMFSKINSTSSKIEQKLSKIEIEDGLDRKIKDLLSKKINKPELTSREKKILDCVEKGRQKFYEDVRKEFSKQDVNVCPYCFQEINVQQKEEIVDNINKVLNREVDEHKIELENINLPDIEKIDVKFKELNEDIYLKLNEKIEEYSKYKNELEKRIENKVENIYIPQNIEVLHLKDKIEYINKLLLMLEQSRQNFNSNVDNKEKMKRELIDLNYKIAWYEIEQNYLRYEKQKEEMQNIIKDKENYELEIDKIGAEIKKLENQKSNKTIALSKINKWIRYILYSKDRLTIECVEDEYCVKVRGRDVRLENLSVGERNIISLCYFFTTMLDQVDEANEFKEPYLILLDDPISSFDFENKIGIYTFFRYIFSKIIKNNLESRIICFTHSLEAVFNLEKVMSDINKENKCKYSFKELKEFKILDFQFNKRNEYGQMLQNIYDFASETDKSDELEDKIGNIMRRALEAFSTFNYGIKIEEISLDEDILSKISEDKREYFRNSMYRLVLNEESHSYNRARNIPYTNFFQYLSKEEKIRTAKDVLIFLYLIDEVHIARYIPKGLEMIKCWDEELKDII